MTYNRTMAVERVQDILTALSYLENSPDINQLDLVGIEKAGLWCLMARPLAHSVHSTVVDIRGFNPYYDKGWIKQAFIPLVQRVGGMDTIIALTAPGRLFLHNCSDGFSATFARTVYKIKNASQNLRVKKQQAVNAEIIRWLQK